MSFTNLPLRYIEEQPHFLELFLDRGMNPELGFDALALERFSPDWHKKTARVFHDVGLACAVHLPFFDLRPGSLDPMILKASRDRLLDAVEVAQVYNPAHFIAHLDYNAVTYSHFENAWLENSLATWEMVLDQTAGTPLYLENVFELTWDHHLRVLEGLGGRAGACLDVGHWHCFARGERRRDLTQWLTALDPFLGHLHLHDNDGSTDQHLGLGRGTIPWEELWAWLEKRKTPVSATFEPHTQEDFLATKAYLRGHGLKLSAPR
jgi:sugar phosphate isomerase/epimerase